MTRTYNSEPAGFLGIGNDLKDQRDLNTILKTYILKKCTEYQYCCQVDFDNTALEALFRMPLIQALQTVEHYATSVSERIMKKPAYLMGILHGQQNHWGKVNSQIKCSSNLPVQVVLCIGTASLKGNCIPSDFTPEVCQQLDALPLKLGLKAVGAFNNNKRIVAGAKGGVINRSRFFLRLIQNVAEQSQPSHMPQLSTDISSYSGSESGGVTGRLSFVSNTSSRMTQLKSSTAHANEINLEQIADLDFTPPPSRDRLRELQIELRHRKKREQILINQVRELEQRLHLLQTECSELRKTAVNHEQNLYFDSLNKF